MRIVVVDDLAENRYFLEALLRGHGHEVVSARNGEEALAELRRLPADLVISDVLMPGMDGYQLCREMRVDARLAAIPLVFYTATYTSEEDRDFALGLGASAFVVKPTAPEEFIGIVRAVVAGASRVPVEVPDPEILKEQVFQREHDVRVSRKLEKKLEELEAAHRVAEESRRELEVRNEALRLLNGLAARLQQRLAVSAIAGEAADTLARHGRSARAAVYLLSDDGTQLRLAGHRGLTPEEAEAAAIVPVDGSLAGLALRERRIVTTADLSGDDRAFLATRRTFSARGVSSVVAVPLVFGEQALGALGLLSLEPREPGPLDVEIYQAIAHAVSLALTNARQLEGLEYQAFHDPLTRLPNRACLHRDFPALVARDGTTAAAGLVLLDLDRFREINDALGHSVGDGLLVQVGLRLLGEGERNGATVYRLGGDEFAVLLAGRGRTEGTEAEARRLLEVLARPLDVAGLSLEVRASAGVATYPDDAPDSHGLLRCADVALYHAKRSPDSVAGYSRPLDRDTPERLALLSELSRAIRDGGLAVHFQPQVDLASNEVSGFEALVRWPHARLGLLPPSAFVPLAEGSEMINPLTYRVVEDALAQLRRWHVRRPGLTMGINLSVRNLLDRNCAQRLEEIIERAGVEPSLVEFELTETAVMSDPDMALAVLGRITATGARLSIDDFGTGFFSLAYLKQFPVSGIKIDRSFVAEIARFERSAAIVRSSIDLARSLGLRVVAEGIEDRATADRLLEMGCGLGQGFYFARPGPADVVDSLLGRSLPSPGVP